MDRLQSVANIVTGGRGDVMSKQYALFVSRVGCGRGCQLAFIFSLQGCVSRPMAGVCCWVSLMRDLSVWPHAFYLAMVVEPFTQRRARENIGSNQMLREA